MKTYLFAVCVSALVATGAMAQTSEPEAEPIDEIIVEGQRFRGGDRAMDAFFNGDFETAEIEFKRNIRIIKRGRTQIEAASSNAISDNLNQIGGQTVSAGSQATAGQVLNGFSGSTVPVDIRAGRSGDVVSSGSDMGFQHYMAGLSQLQLGKVDDAEDSFRSAVHHNDTLYDARMRLALIRLGQGDVDFARNQHADLARKLERCGGRCVRPEELQEAEAALRQFLARLQ